MDKLFRSYFRLVQFVQRSLFRKGPEKILEIDQSKFDKRKYRKESIIKDDLWVLRGIEGTLRTVYQLPLILSAVLHVA